MTTATLTPNQVFNDPYLFAETFLWIRDKQKRLIRLRYNPVQQIYLRNRRGHKKNATLKARHVGISTVIQGDLFRIGTTRPIGSTTISHLDESTQKFRRMVDRFYVHLPEGFKPRRKYANAKITTYTELDSESEISTAGNLHTGRGGTNTHIHGSEVAFWSDATAIMNGLMQAGDPAVELETTPNGAYGYFFELAMETMEGGLSADKTYWDGDNGWRLHFYPWWLLPEYNSPAPLDFHYDDDPLVNKWNFTSEEQLAFEHKLTNEQIMWRRWKIKELKQAFIQEYPEDPINCFLTSGNSYFAPLVGVFAAPLRADYITGHTYVGGLDFGQDQDYTALIVIDVTTRQMVDFYRMRQAPWSEMRGEVVKRCKKWNITNLQVEKNSMGSTNAEELRKELKTAGAVTSNYVWEFVTTNASKADIMAALHEGLHEAGLKLQDIPVVRGEMNKFSRIRLPGGGWKLEAPSNEHDDTVIALALAWYAANVRPSKVETVQVPDWNMRGW